jgi:uncharacterized repeat protein (TIGR03847 family)
VSSSHDFPDPESVMPGAVGQPGDRTFFLQVAAGGASTSFKVEKQQVAALCEYLGGILADLAPVDDTERVSSAVPSVPDSLEWVVGRLAVAYEEADDRIVVVAEEFVQIERPTPSPSTSTTRRPSPLRATSPPPPASASPGPRWPTSSPRATTWCGRDDRPAGSAVNPSTPRATRARG